MPHAEQETPACATSGGTATRAYRKAMSASARRTKRQNGRWMYQVPSSSIQRSFNSVLILGYPGMIG